MEPHENPYQSPAAAWGEYSGQDGLEAHSPHYKLYSIGSIVLATFLGSPLAGGVLMAINYARLGRTAAAIHAVVWSAAAITAIIGGTMLLSDDTNIPNLVAIAPQVIGMYFVARALQERDIESHQQSGGQLASAWGAAGIAIAAAVLILVVLFAVLMVLD